MACLIKRPDSKYWIASFTDLHGRRLKRSTKVLAKEKTRKQALEIAEGFEAVSAKKRSALHVRRVISDLHQKITGEAMANKSLRKYVESWLSVKKHEVTDSTLLTYSADTKRLIEFLGDRADLDVSEVSRQDMLDFRDDEMSKVSPASVNDRIKVLRMVFKSARREGLISDNPLEFVDAVRGAKRRKKQTFTIDQLRAVIDAADDEWRSMILFGLYTGLRLGDVARLTWANLDLQSQELCIAEKKGDRYEKIILQPLAGPLLAHVESLPVSDDPNAPIHSRAFESVGRKGSTSPVSGQFVDLLVSVGLRQKKAHRKTHGMGRGIGSSTGGLTFHCLRHTAVTMLKEAGIPAATVMELTGHSSKEMSEHYTHVGKDSLKLAAEAFPSLLGEKPKGGKVKK